ncbi:MAG: GDYXXLXY domain-containing protein [Pseudomonadota bacterium]
MTNPHAQHQTPPRRRLGQDWTLGFFRARALLALIILLGVLGLMIFQAERDRTSGRELILQAAPFDPRDVFFGHYATLRYNIATMSLEPLMDEKLMKEILDLKPSAEYRYYYPKVGEDPLYIAFEKRGRFHEPVRVARNRADLPKTNVVLKAYGRARINQGCTEAPCAYSFRIAFDLPRRYYADRETALAIEKLARKAGRFQRQQRLFERCERERARLASDPERRLSRVCETVTERPDPEEATDFGVILSLPEGRDPVIRGLLIDDRRIIDQLTGSNQALAPADANIR